uniref:RNase H type-1 domain-containing protein n=1 Tax=Cannabis sativa TaxID=3483 RepID=A0A803NIG2_CANSA
MNELLHNKLVQDAPLTIQWTKDYLLQYQQHNAAKTPHKIQDARSPSFHWQPAPPGQLKLNVDAAQNIQKNMLGFGLIVQNHTTNVVVALAIPWRGVHQPVMMEAYSLQLALEWCQKNSLMIHQIKSDCPILVDVVLKGYSNNIHLQEFIININSLPSSFPQASISYIPQEANYAAHSLAKRSCVDLKITFGCWQAELDVDDAVYAQSGQLNFGVIVRDEWGQYVRCSLLKRCVAKIP